MNIDFPDVAVGAVAAAIVAGAIALANLVGGKENKISEFRQTWIDALRAETSRVIAHASIIDGMIGVNFEDRQAIWRAAREDWFGFVQAASNIRMRLNPEETPSKEVLGRLRELQDLFQGGSGGLTKPPPEAVGERSTRLADAVNLILRNDWGRVKRGEPKYRVAVWTCAIVLLTALGIISYATFQHSRNLEFATSPGVHSPASVGRESGALPAVGRVVVECASLFHPTLSCALANGTEGTALGANLPHGAVERILLLPRDALDEEIALERGPGLLEVLTRSDNDFPPITALHELRLTFDGPRPPGP